MPTAMEQSPSDKTYYKPKQQNETLSFQKTLLHDSAKTTPTHEHTVRRTWGHQATLEAVQAGSQQGQDSANHTGIGTMMDMWLKEKNREQPYNNIASYKTKTVKSFRAEKAANQHQGSTLEGSHKGTSTSSYSGKGSEYPSIRR